ncbi:hypothetical protein [Sporosarcina sp. FA9]|uniref:hypothetical protein n=1 Tax=Sporosarcina sp. FA9 TaxID=3413030 RepID=UPI003F65BC8D
MSSTNKKPLLIETRTPWRTILFYQAYYAVVTENLGNISITTEQLTDFPSLIKQLNEQAYERVSPPPNKLVALANYGDVGNGTLEKFWGIEMEVIS